MKSEPDVEVLSRVRGVSECGRWAVASPRKGSGYVDLYDLLEGRHVKRMEVVESQGCAFNKDAKVLFTTDWDSGIRAYEVETGRLLWWYKRWKEACDPVYDPDQDRLFCSNGARSRCLVLNATTGKLVIQPEWKGQWRPVRGTKWAIGRVYHEDGKSRLEVRDALSWKLLTQHVTEVELSKFGINSLGRHFCFPNSQFGTPRGYHVVTLEDRGGRPELKITQKDLLASHLRPLWPTGVDQEKRLFWTYEDEADLSEKEVWHRAFDAETGEDHLNIQVPKERRMDTEGAWVLGGSAYLRYRGGDVIDATTLEVIHSRLFAQAPPDNPPELDAKSKARIQAAFAAAGLERKFPDPSTPSATSRDEAEMAGG